MSRTNNVRPRCALCCKKYSPLQYRNKYIYEKWTNLEFIRAEKHGWAVVIRCRNCGHEWKTESKGARNFFSYEIRHYLMKQEEVHVNVPHEIAIA